MIPLKHVHIIDQNIPPGDPLDPKLLLADLSAVYDWCVYQNYQPILKSGKLFMGKGLRGQYEYICSPNFYHHTGLSNLTLQSSISNWFW